MSGFDQASLFDAPAGDVATPDAAKDATTDATPGTTSDATVLCLVGPTASGKSAVALEVARLRGDVEVVAIDAFTIYRGMDLGTAKPTQAERAEVPHHMVDVLDPTEAVTVAWFRDRAREAIADVHARGRVPLLVGGSGLYFRAVVDPLDFPPTDDAVRAEVEQRWVDDVPGAYAHLVEVDPDAAEKIEPDNLRRVVRALEVLELTGRPFSSFRSDWDDHTSIFGGLRVARLDPDPDELRRRIDARAEQMVADGLVEECRRLREEYGEPSETARQAIGYAEAFAVLDGEASADGLATAVAKRTRNYARRQRARFRKDPRCEVRTPRAIVADFTA